MSVCYSIFIFFYGLLMHFVSFFNIKARKWVLGRKNWENDLKEKLTRIEPTYWIHCSSAGEFEQAIPLIERIRSQESRVKTKRIAVSFFSPSGFEMYKDSGLAEVFFYLPLDTRKNAATLIAMLNPVAVIFIRNEIWWNMLSALKKKKIPAYLVNVNLAQKRNFFYQIYLDNVYPLFSKIFDTKTYGNTKLEKVIENRNTIYRDEILEDFSRDSLVIILGSSWATEEIYISNFYKKYKDKISNLKIIIAPHEFDKSKRDSLEKLFQDTVISYTDFLPNSSSSILFLDKMGILKYVYRYTDLVFIGGGFEKTVHNISEAAVYGIPVLSGPNYKQFEEANELTDLNLLFPVYNYAAFETKLLQLINDTDLRRNIRAQVDNYFSQQEKSAARIISEILS